MKPVFANFLRDESAAITVDWVVLSAGAVAMSLAATGVVRGGLAEVSSNLEAQLRSQQISDAFVNFTSNHFDKLYDDGIITEEQAGELFDLANTMTNAQILTALEEGIENMVNETISDAELAELYALASVAYQRNIVSDEVIHYYFGDDDGNYGGDDEPDTDV